MEILRITPLDGGEPKAYLRCEVHNWFFNNRPPLVSGCTSCWMCYYLGQRAQMKPELMDMGLQELETALLHMQEECKSGKWDLDLYPHPEVHIEKEN